MPSPKISVIVPVYNVEKYLPRCIDSILSQTFIDFELLLIDDGSIDGSGKICNEYVSKDDRIRAFHKPNGGVSSARNVGLDNAQGEWVTFVDSDDYIDDDFLASMLTAVSNGVDFVACGCHDDIVSSDMELLFLGDKTVYTVPWGKLYKLSIIEDNSIRFNEKVKLGEDAVFLYTYILHVNTLSCLRLSGYHYNTDSTNSLSKRLFTAQEELDAYNAVKHAMAKLVDSKLQGKTNAIDALEMIMVYFVKRTLDSVYHNKLNRKDRFDTLGKLDMALYANRLIPTSCRETIFVSLLKNRHLVFYDVLRTMVVSIKRV